MNQMPDPHQVEELFAQGLNKPVQEHAAWLEAACRGDAELRARIEVW